MYFVSSWLRTTTCERWKAFLNNGYASHILSRTQLRNNKYIILLIVFKNNWICAVTDMGRFSGAMARGTQLLRCGVHLAMYNYRDCPIFWDFTNARPW